MGTDIHAQVEVKRDGEWVWALRNLPDGFKSSQFTGLDTSRNYTLFSVLADVRNGTGFAGVDTGDRIEPISEPRGLPKDMDPELRRAITEDDVFIGDHSHSYLYLEELLEYDWEKEIVERGFISRSQYEEWDGEGRPPGMVSGGVGGKNVTKVPEEEMEKIISEDREVEGKLYTQVEWRREIKDAIGFDQFWSWTSSLKFSVDLKYVDINEEPRKLRVVFGFDS